MRLKRRDTSITKDPLPDSDIAANQSNAENYMDFRELLRHLVNKEGSDLYLTTGAPPSLKVNGEVVALNRENLTPNIVREMAMQIMDPDQRAQFEATKEMNLALSEKGIGRFRVNIFVQRNQVAMVIRHIKTDIPKVQDLGLPPILTEVILEKRGLFLVVGATGSGKSTSLASLIDYRNENSCGHIISVEVPIEYLHVHKNSIINQREVGIDTESYEAALVNTLRQAPDVILVGEIRTQETMQHAITFAETGHLCLSTLHANNANQALDRIINFFPEEKHNQLLLDLSLNLRAIISQRLIPTVHGHRVAAFEVLLNTPLMSDLIRRKELHSLKELMIKSEPLGMLSFDSSLYQLYKSGMISYQDALANSDSKNNLRLRISLDQNAHDSSSFQMEEQPSDENPLFRKSLEKLTKQRREAP